MRVVTLRADEDEYRRWVEQAGYRNFSAWAREVLNAAAAKAETEEGSRPVCYPGSTG